MERKAYTEDGTRLTRPSTTSSLYSASTSRLLLLKPRTHLINPASLYFLSEIFRPPALARPAASILLFRKLVCHVHLP
jgi:hypothetical protein